MVSNQALQAGLLAVALSDVGCTSTPTPQSVKKGDRKSKGKDFKTSLRDAKGFSNSRFGGVRQFSALGHATHSTHSSNAPITGTDYSPIDDPGQGRYLYEELHTLLLKTQQRNSELEEESRKLKEENEALTTRFEDQDSIVRKAQESAFAFIKSRAPTAEDDDVIRERLRSVISQWRPFAKKWALANLKDLKEEYNKEATEILDSNSIDGDQEDGPEGLMGDNNLTKAPGILLNAELAGFIDENIISMPFISAFALKTVSDDGTGDSYACIIALDRIYDSSKAGKYSIERSTRKKELNYWQKTGVLLNPGEHKL